jgi:hypothetical protein
MIEISTKVKLRHKKLGNCSIWRRQKIKRRAKNESYVGRLCVERAAVGRSGRGGAHSAGCRRPTASLFLATLLAQSAHSCFCARAAPITHELKAARMFSLKSCERNKTALSTSLLPVSISRPPPYHPLSSLSQFSAPTLSENQPRFSCSEFSDLFLNN